MYLSVKQCPYYYPSGIHGLYQKMAYLLQAGFVLRDVEDTDLIDLIKEQIAEAIGSVPLMSK